jgi:hypothetical protein
MRYRIVTLVFIVWIVLWACFFARELFVKGNMRDYRELISRTLDGKRSYVTGDNLYEFLVFCWNNAPKGSTYALEGLDEGSIEQRRAAYYLYPLIEGPNPDLVFVYNKASLAKSGYAVVAALDDSRYILKKVK